MLNFLRKLRRKNTLPNSNQTMASPSTTARYLKYALGEILLVVIGILIALSINNWNEKAKKRRTSNKALKELQGEIAITKGIIESGQELNHYAVEVMKRFLEDDFQNPTDSTKAYVVGFSFAYSPLDLSIPLLDREISAEHLIIDQPALITELRALKNLQSVAEQERYYLDEYWNRNMITYLKEQGLMLSFVSKAGGIDKNVDGMEKLYHSAEFKDVMSMEYFHVKNYAERIDRIYKQFEAIEKMLEAITGEPHNPESE